MPRPASRPTSRFATRTPTALAIAAVLMAACPSLAMQQDDDDTPDKPLLAGPTVGADASKPTLVRYDFSGEFQRLERHPAEAALDLIRERADLDDATQAAIEAILNERRKILDELVIDRLDLLIKLGNGGDDRDRNEAIAALRQAMAPLAVKGPLGERIREHLPADAAKEHERLEKQYVRASVADRLALLEAEDTGERRPRGLRMRAQAIETLVGLGAEVRGAYERTLVQDGQQLETLLNSLNLSPEQDGKVRAIIAQYTDKALLDKKSRENDGTRMAVFLRVAAELTAEQRRTLIESARGER